LSDAPIVISRWLHFLSLAIVFGASLFWLYAVPARLPAGLGFERRADRIIRLFAFLALLTGVGWLASSIVQVSGGVSQLFDRETLSDFFLETSFGPVWTARLLLLAALLGFALALPYGRRKMAKRSLIALTAAVAFASQAWLGHAAMARGNGLSVELACYMAHVPAAGAWIGGLVPLALLSFDKGLGEEPLRAKLFATLLTRFSHLGMALVLVILVSGIANSVFRLRALSDLLTLDYGHTILAKVFLFLLMLALAAMNRWRLLPAIKSRPEAAIRALRRSVLGEQMLGAVVLLLAAILGILPPRG
jgi:putative copper resistance protein D